MKTQMTLEQIEDLTASIEGIINGRTERVIKLIKLVQKADGTSLLVHTEDLLNEMDQLKFELRTILNFMETVQ